MVNELPFVLSAVKTSTEDKEERRFELTCAASTSTVPVTLLLVYGSHLLLLGSMYLFVYCLTWLHVCTDSRLSFIVSLLLLPAVQCSHSLIIIYRLHLPSLCRCSLELSSQPNLLMKLLLVLSLNCQSLCCCLLCLLFHVLTHLPVISVYLPSITAL